MPSRQGALWGLPRDMRLTRSSDYRRAFAEGRRISRRHFTLVVRQNRLDHARLGIVVSKRIAKAVRRNRIKRVIREGFRTDPVWRRIPFDTVVVVRSPLDKRNCTTMVSELRALIGKMV